MHRGSCVVERVCSMSCHEPENGVSVVVVMLTGGIVTVIISIIVITFGIALIVVLQVAVPASRAHSAFWHKGQLLGDG